MRQDKQLAINLRKQGKSYNEISGILNVSKSTLSNWFQKVTWSQKTKKHLSYLARKDASIRMTAMSDTRRKSLQASYRRQRSIARKQFEEFKQDRLFIAGLTIYWGEGDNKLEDGVIRVANTDPAMIRLFYDFLKKYLPEISDKAKIYLVLYPDLDDISCKRYWSTKVGIPLKRFINSSVIVGKSKKRTISYGIGTITISSRLYKESIITWIDLLKKENIADII